MARARIFHSAVDPTCDPVCGWFSAVYLASTIQKDFDPFTQPARSFWSSCSQIRATLKLLFANSITLLRSRLTLRRILAAQNGELFFGMWPQRGQPCQKQPSTKTASLLLTKTKSGFPGKPGRCSFHPLKPALTKANRRRISVVRLLRPRTALIFLAARGLTRPPNLWTGSGRVIGDPEWESSTTIGWKTKN